MFGQLSGTLRRRSNFSSNTARRRQPRNAPLSPFSKRLWFEPLEDRRLLSVGPTIVSTTPSLLGGTLNVATWFAVNFSTAMIGADTASNYRLQSVGTDGLLGTADDSLVAVTVSYRGTTGTLQFSGAPHTVYRLTVSDAIMDTSGNKLDGDGDGFAGGNWVRDFVGVVDGFAAATTYPAGGSGTDDIETGDLNADGKLDLVVTNAYSNTVALLMGGGNGTFSPATTLFSGGFEPYAPTIADFNVDGKLDVAVVNYYSGTIGVLLGDGTGGFAPAVPSTAGASQPSDLTIGDFDHDDKLDLAVALGTTGIFGVLLGNGNGTFQPVTTFGSGGTNALGIVAADFDSDDNLDLAITNNDSATVGVCLGDGTGGFSSVTTVSTGGTNPMSLDAGDFNADGKIDLALANWGSGDWGSNAAVLHGNGDGTFQPAVTYAAGRYLNGTTARDINGDGKLDIAVSGSGLGVLTGKGDGTFDPIYIYSIPSPRAYVTTLGDFDGDGDLDAAAAIGSSVAVLRNHVNASWATLISPHSLPFDVLGEGGGTGELLQGYNNAFDGDGRLMIGSTQFTSTAIPTMVDGGRTVVTGTGTFSGLTVARRITVPGVGNEDFARTIDTFTNPTAAAITTTVTIVGNLGSGAATRVFATSDGDAIVEPTDLWVGTYGGPGTPAVIHYLQGPAASLRPIAGQRAIDNLSWTYQIVVPAAQSLRLAYYTIVADTPETAVAAAAALVMPSGFGAQATAFLSPEEVQSLENFVNTNHAPVLAHAAPLMGEIDEDASLTLDLATSFINHGVGTTTVTDADSGAVVGGIALTGAAGSGAWSYSLDGMNYSPLGAVNDTQALLLPRTARLKYTPNQTGVETATITYRAWDTTFGTPGTKVSAAVCGGTTTFSTDADTASLSVLSVNQAPVLTPASPVLAVSDQSTTLILDLASFINYGADTTQIVDADHGDAVGGIAITCAQGHGVWSYSLDGANFYPIGPASVAAALLLPPTAKLSYTPGPGGEVASIAYRAWDMTSGMAADRVDVSHGGGATAFSSIADTATIALPLSAALVVRTMPSLTFGAVDVGAGRITIDFSEAVAGADTAANYRLQSAGSDGLLGTADDATVQLSANSTGPTATLTFSSLIESVYRFTVFDAITDAHGNKLDGDADGVAGGNWVQDFVGSRDAFSTATTYATGGTGGCEVETADLNADGKLDLVVANFVSDTVALLIGNGDGTFSAPTAFSSGGSDPYAPTIADFNGDGKLDVAVVNFGSANVGVLLGSGTGGFAPAIPYAAGASQPSDLTTGDFNRDGAPDLAIVNMGAGFLHGFGVLLGNGDGTFQPVSNFSSGGWNSYGITTADFNGDGKLDLAATNNGGSTIGICLGNGAGGFSAVTIIPSGGYSPEFLDTGDFNGDGRIDLAVANQVSGSSEGNVAVLLGNGDGTFQPAVTYACANRPIGIVARDIDGDGKLDIVASGSAWGGGPTPKGALGVLTGKGDGTFDPIRVYTLPSRAYVTALGDFDGDGDLDAAAAISSSVAVLRNHSDAGWITLISPHGLPFDVLGEGGGAGELLPGQNNAFDGDGSLMVDRTSFFTAAPPSTMDGGCSVVTRTGTFSGLQVVRKLTVPNTGSEDFARTIDMFTNATAAAITTTVTIVGNLGSDGNTRVFATSDGDTIVESTDQWFGTDGGPGTTAVIHYLHGPAGWLPTSTEVIGDNVRWTYNVTLQPGETIRLGYFTIVADTEADAVAAANALVGANGLGGQAAAFLSADELASLGNFSFAPAVAWTGAGSAIWSTATGLNNWKKTSDATTADYANGANVVFDDTAASATVDISAAPVAPGRVVFNNAGQDFTIAGMQGIAGAATTVTKQGAGTVTVSSANTYGGVTTIEGGKLVLQGSAKAMKPVLDNGGADIKGGMLVLDYVGESSPVDTVKSLLTASYNAAGSSRFDTGKFRSTTADATHGLGWVDNTATSKISIAYTIYGDADLDGSVGLSDLGKVLTNWGTGTTWSDGDFDYNGSVGLSDLGKVLTNWGLSVGTLTPATTVNIAAPASPQPAASGFMPATAEGATGMKTGTGTATNRSPAKGTVPFSPTTASPRCPRKLGQSPGLSPEGREGPAALDTLFGQWALRSNAEAALVKGTVPFSSDENQDSPRPNHRPFSLGASQQYGSGTCEGDSPIFVGRKSGQSPDTSGGVSTRHKTAAIAAAMRTGAWASAAGLRDATSPTGNDDVPESHDSDNAQDDFAAPLDLGWVESATAMLQQSSR